MSFPAHAFRPVVVFDLDGTLVDTAPDLAATMNAVLAGLGRSTLAPETVRNLVGRGAGVLMGRAMAETGPAASPAEIARLTEEFVEIYAGRIAEESRPFPGAVAAMDRLAALGSRLAICTNKREGLSRLLLDALGLEGRFAAVIGGDTLPVAKPDPRPLAEAIARAGGAPGTAVLVGDTATDVACARAAGVAVIGVSFGYSETPMAELGADRLIDRFDQLPGAVAELLPALARAGRA
jgi:phosphoglycolate phosphatase